MSTTHRNDDRRALQGQTLILFALMSLMLLAGLGLIIDAGYDYSKRRIMQNAADIAALRGARKIAQVGTSTSPGILQEVRDTAIANGVPSEYESLIVCNYIDNARNILSSCQDNSAVPSNASGVYVRVEEEHPTLIMRAVGVATSGTAANSAAQIRMLSELNVLDVPFAVCGKNAALTNGGTVDILQTQFFTPTASPSASPTPSPVERVSDGRAFNTSAYTYDWNVRGSSGAFISQSPRPAARIWVYGDNIGDCDMNGWKGLIDHSDSVAPIFLDSTDTGTDVGVVLRAGYGDGVGGSGENRFDPERTIDGVLGCRPNQAPNGCVLILPIVYNFPDCGTEPCENFPAPPNQFAGDGTGPLFLARWGAFLMYTETGGYSGELIRNYPIQAAGLSNWTRSMTEPITITLVQVTPP